MNLAQVKQTTLGLILAHNDRNGRGPDPFQPALMMHAMAEGKLLAAVAELLRCGAVSASWSESMSLGSIRRLAELQIPTQYGPAFGLGFAWKGMPANTPFTITTSIVVDGLERFAAVTDNPGPFEDMANAARRWLVSPDVVDSESGLPFFSPAYRTVVTNVVGYWVHVLRNSHPELANTGDQYVRNCYVGGVGWPYTSTDRRLDLLHTCYTARGLLLASDFSIHIASAISRFITPGALLDKVDAVPVREAVAIASRSTKACVALGENIGYVLHHAPARTWSIGELLSICAARPGGSEYSGFWRSLATRSIAEIEVRDVEVDGPRHAMHVAYGLAAHLATARGNSG